MKTAIEKLLDILDLERLEHNLFRGSSPDDGWQRVFGGQVIGQALVAAARTVDDRSNHSLHGYFIRPGDPKVPIIYEVKRLRDGKSFSTRQVIGIQHGEAIFSMGASFHNNEEGFEHQQSMPDVPAPDELPSEEEMKDRFLKIMPDDIKAYWQQERPIEMRPVDVSRYFASAHRQAEQHVWIRATGPLPDDLATHQCVLAYASDFTILDTALIAHGRMVFDPSLQVASLDHAIWFQREFRADDWLLYSQNSPSSFGARGFCRGNIFSKDGTLVASVCQEGLIREKREK